MEKISCQRVTLKRGRNPLIGRGQAWQKQNAWQQMGHGHQRGLGLTQVRGDVRSYQVSSEVQVRPDTACEGRRKSPCASQCCIGALGFMGATSGQDAGQQAGLGGQEGAGQQAGCRMPIRFLSGAFSSFGMHAAVPTSCSTSTAAAHPYRWVGR